MNIRVNGADKAVEAATVAELLAGMGVGAATRGVAVALNAALVPRARWSDTKLGEGDHVEIVRPFAGG